MMISQRSHPLLKELRELRDKPTADLLFLEGPKLLEEALQAKIVLKTLIFSNDFKDTAGLTERARAKAKSTFTVSESIFKSVSDLVEPQGVLAIGERPRWTWEHLLAKSPAPVIILDGLQNPGNVAAIARTAEAAGAAGLVTTPATARLTSPKALRGAMGSSLRLPAVEHVSVDEIIDRLPHGGYLIYGTMADKKKPHKHLMYTEVNWTHASAVILGQEGAGVSKPWEPYIHNTVIIPMQPPVESLNVAAAAAILLYEALRQRQETPR